tara:strand:- start:1650 stop:2018 length:369 start_codon:yes stop_codon:yes gene_type:complete
MTEKQYEKAMLAIGCKNVTTNRQIANGTTAYRLPTGQVVSEHKTGYIRRNLYAEKVNSGGRTGMGGKCYQLNPTYNVPHQSIGQDGKLYKYEGSKARTLIWSRKTRLKKLFLYTIKKVNNEG